MARFIARRLVLLVLVLLAVTMLAFFAMNVLGDPLFNELGPAAELDCDAIEAGLAGVPVDEGAKRNCERIAEIRAVYHLDRAVPVQYLLWLSDIASGDFGKSFKNQQPVSELIRARMPETLILLAMAQTVALGAAVPWGVIAAYRANRRLDKYSTVASFGLLSVPNFALGVVLLYLLALRWQVFPAAYQSGSPGQVLFSLILPAFTLGLPLAAVYQRLLRTDLMTTLQEDFVHMARAKGLPPLRIMFRHALRPSFFSVATVFGVNTGALIGGALVVEVIFAIPGIGFEIVEAVRRADFPVVLGMVVVIAVGFVVINFLVDLFYTWLDPRVRAQ